MNSNIPILNATVFPQLGDMFFIKYKGLEELHKSEIIQNLHKAYIAHVTGKYFPSKKKPDDKTVERELNLAYRICAEVVEDDSTKFDAWAYGNMAERSFGGIDKDFVLSFVYVLMDGFIKYSQYYSQCKNHDKIEKFRDDVPSYIIDSDVNIIGSIDWKECKDDASQLDLRPSPTSPKELEYCFGWKEATNDYKQEDIRKIVFRYKTTKDRLDILSMIREEFEGEDKLPF